MHYSLSLDECLLVGSVQISVLEVMHDSVRLGINDPKACPPYREEILFMHSEDDGSDDGEEAHATFDSLEIRDYSPFAIPFV